MDAAGFWQAAVGVAPLLGMAAMALLAAPGRPAGRAPWRAFRVVSLAGLVLAALALVAGPEAPAALPGLKPTTLGLVLALLVQALGTVVGAFSARYLQGEPGQARYVAALAAVLAAVHALLLADHWAVLVAAWAAVGLALQPLLCFYPDRPFARLAAHKKRLADRVADALLLVAAGLAWAEVGSGSLTALWAHVGQHGLSPALQASALALVGAVVLRTALLPVHGWLIQVMEAPTPVSALLHAGVVNLGGFVLVRFAPLLEQAMPARALLLALGLATAVLAGMVMLTRISIKVRLAWSTVAQMGFMLLECALGLYTLAALHLVGHSIYKAHAFLSASSVVRQARLDALHATGKPRLASLLLAPVLALAVVLAVPGLPGHAGWPAWWSVLLALAWAPLLWLPEAGGGLRRLLAGVLLVALLAAAARLAHALPLDLVDAPHEAFGWVALAGLAWLYGCLALLQRQPHRLSRWRRWSYAGFYVDEAYTRVALWLWPTRWTPATPASAPATAGAPR